ncbi:MAG: TonB family protein [Prevotella nigrescens]|uniref:TonB family protein n=1 Tax=Prevotella nigrescens TaxID=28133 RepID=A0A9D6AA62_9BACT|nr:M56 family metallopeptidase [Prevotella nigrescens]MBF1446689.1 TonB family protein [Prevotella nigrescens]
MTMYLLKLNLALIVLFGFYKLMFSGDTFFALRRATLIGMCLVAMLVPGLNCSYWINKSVGMVSMANEYAAIVLPAVTVTPGGGGSIGWETTAMTIYTMVACLFLLRFFWQLVSIVRLRNKCRTTDINGTKVYLLESDEGPFSFFNWIFINPTKHNRQETDEIMTHELAHCRQLHSVDILFTELFAIVFWANPFVWLLKREVRLNLEYLADNNVLAGGTDSKKYQYHLLGLAYRKNVATISNNFNVLPLKKRIKMMNKKRTKRIAKVKYALYIPLAAALLVVSNIETVARDIANVAKAMPMAKASVKQEKMVDLSFSNKATVAVESRKNVQSTEAIERKDNKMEVQADNRNSEMSAQKVEETTEVANEESVEKGPKKSPKKVYEHIENMPTFNGNLNQWLLQNMKYPVEAMNKKEQGKVIVQFIVSENGEVSEPKIIRSVSPALDKEACRIVLAMPKWNPGKLKGKPVAVRYMLPITFRLQ